MKKKIIFPLLFLLLVFATYVVISKNIDNSNSQFFTKIKLMIPYEIRQSIKKNVFVYSYTNILENKIAKKKKNLADLSYKFTSIHGMHFKKVINKKIITSQNKKKYDIPVGFSDHTEGNLAPIISIMFGACMIEKHFNLEGNQSLDSFFSSDPKSFKKLVDNIRILEKEINFKKYKISKTARENRNAMRSIYISKNVKKNEIISVENIKTIRPSYGLNPIHYDKILRKKFNGSYKIGQKMSFNKIKK